MMLICPSAFAEKRITAGVLTPRTFSVREGKEMVSLLDNAMV